MLESLEKRLEAADTGLSTLVFYHLRALWGDGREIIGLLVQDLAAKQEERERKAWALEGNRKQFQQRQAAEQQLRQAESLMVAARQQLAAFDARLAKLDKWWHRWQRPKVAAQRPALQAAVDAAEANLRRRAGALRTTREDGRGRIPGHFRRGQARHQSRGDRLRRSVVPAPGAHQSGGVGACRHGAARVARILRRPRGLRVHHERHRQGAEPAQAARRHHAGSRAAHASGCARTAAYLGDFETVPIPESCGVSEGDVLAHGSQGVTSARLPNVVAEDTWDLFKVLLR